MGSLIGLFPRAFVVVVEEACSSRCSNSRLSAVVFETIVELFIREVIISEFDDVVVVVVEFIDIESSSSYFDSFSFSLWLLLLLLRWLW